MYDTADAAIERVFKKLLTERSLDEISVVMLCKQTKVNRQTFYYHYSSMADLLRTVLRRDYEEVFSSGKPAVHTTAQIVEKTLTYLHDNRDWLLHVYHSEYRRQYMDLLKYLIRRVLAVSIEQFASVRQMSIEEDDRDFIINAHLSVIMDILVRYHEDEMRPDIMQLAIRVERLLDSSRNSTLHRFDNSGIWKIP